MTESPETPSEQKLEPISSLTPVRVAHVVADLLEDKKVENLVVLDISASTTRIADFMVIATGTSGRQVKAVAEDLSKHIKARGDLPRSITGADLAWWVCVDLGDVVVHLMQEEARVHYDLEALWADAEVVRRGVSADELDPEA